MASDRGTDLCRSTDRSAVPAHRETAGAVCADCRHGGSWADHGAARRTSGNRPGSVGRRLQAPGGRVVSVTVAAWFDANLLLLVTALLAEAAFGYPKSLLAHISHPVVWIGAMIDGLDARLNRANLPDPQRRHNGIVAVALIVSVSTLPAVVLQVGILQLVQWWVVGLGLALLASTLFAQRSLHDHVADVRDGLRNGGLVEARAKVRLIVGQGRRYAGRSGRGASCNRELVRELLRRRGGTGLLVRVPGGCPGWSLTRRSIPPTA